MMVFLKKVVDSSTWWFLIAGIALGVGFIWPLYWWLVFPGVASFLVAVSRAEARTSVFWGGWLAGTIKMLFSIGWFWTTYPIRWIDLSLGWFELPVIGFYWLTVAISIGVSFGVFGLLLHLLRRYWSRGWLIAACTLWVPAEVLGAWCFSFFTYGEGGQLGSFFSFGMAGYLLAEHPWLLQIARLGGVYALSLVAAGVGAAIFFWRTMLFTPRGYQCLGVCVGLMLGSSFIGLPHSHVDGISVAVVTTQFGGEDFFALPKAEQEKIRLQNLPAAASAAIATGVQYVVMPEESRFIDLSTGPRPAYDNWIKFTQGAGPIVVEAGAVKTSVDTTTLRAMIVEPRTERGYLIDKQLLVPQGEFLPHFTEYTMQIFGLSRSLEYLSDRLSYRPGPYDTQAVFPEHVPGILFCFENVDPLSVKRLTKERKLPFVAHPISHAWFHQPDSLWSQLDAMLQVQAVWNQVPIVSAGNLVEGKLYTPQGSILLPQPISQGEYWQVGIIGW